MAYSFFARYSQDILNRRSTGNVRMLRLLLLLLLFVILFCPPKGGHIIIEYYVSFLYQGTNSLPVQPTTSKIDNHTRNPADTYTPAVSKSHTTDRKLSRTMSNTFLWVLPHTRPFLCISLCVLLYFDLFTFFPDGATHFTALW